MLANMKSIGGDDFEVCFEIESADDLNDNKDCRRNKISQELRNIDNQLDDINSQLEKLNSEIDRLTNHSDGIDYMVAVASGILAGSLDILFVEDLSFEKADQIGNEKVNEFVIKEAKKKAKQKELETGKAIKIDSLYDAVRFLENEYPIVADKATNAFGGGLQHHLRDFSHHPTPIGLFFSMLTQFTRNVYGTNVAGVFQVVPVSEKDFVLIGNNLPEKITFGVINWFFHMVSDIAGSSGKILEGKVGTGLPGPIVSLLKEMSALPIFKKTNEKGYKEFSVWVSKLFNGTLLGERDENGKLVPLKFDLRTEIGLGVQLKQQAMPVVINECIVRGFYFIRRFANELKNNNLQSFGDLKNINWRNTLPANNRTISRMLTISTGTMTAIDLADAAIESAIKSGGVSNPLFVGNMIVKVNFVGVGRFAIAVGTDVSMGVKKKTVAQRRSVLVSQVLHLSNVKLYYKNADLLCELSELYDHEAEMHKAEGDLWIEVDKTEKSMNDLYRQAEKVGIFYAKTVREMDESFDRIERLLPEVESMNPGLTAEILRRLRR